jgi:hypothetical protein
MGYSRHAAYSRLMTAFVIPRISKYIVDQFSHRWLYIGYPYSQTFTRKIKKPRPAPTTDWIWDYFCTTEVSREWNIVDQFSHRWLYIGYPYRQSLISLYGGLSTHGIPRWYISSLPRDLTSWICLTNLYPEDQETSPSTDYRLDLDFQIHCRPVFSSMTVHWVSISTVLDFPVRRTFHFKDCRYGYPMYSHRWENWSTMYLEILGITKAVINKMLLDWEITLFFEDLADIFLLIWTMWKNWVFSLTN